MKPDSEPSMPVQLPVLAVSASKNSKTGACSATRNVMEQRIRRRPSRIVNRIGTLAGAGSPLAIRQNP